VHLTHVAIDHYRSIEHVDLNLPDNRPLVLFGPNNAGKSNILSAIQKALGERWPTTQELDDSDFFMRDRQRYDTAEIRCDFDGPYHIDNRGNQFNSFILHYSNEPSGNLFQTVNGNRLYISRESRNHVQSFLVDADRDISRQFSYYSRYSLLSKFTHALHKALDEDRKNELDAAFETIKETFEGIEEYGRFFDDFHKMVSASVQGFTHGIAADFSAYDPNNYANALQIVATENGITRSFDEFGTGEQQILLMAFAKAYVETFGSGSLVLIIEEPEAHLHPLAQRWLKEYIYELCGNGLQVIISTHSPDFIDMRNLDGLVRVRKNDQGITSVVQLTKTELVKQCVELGVPSTIISTSNVLDFFGTKLFPDEAKGLFADKILIVEGPTEYYALPILFHKLGHSLTKNGIELIFARGKTSIPFYWRLFSAYEIPCSCLFDADVTKQEGRAENAQLSSILGANVPDVVSNCTNRFQQVGNGAFFLKDYESFMRESVSEYTDLEERARNDFGISSKPGVAAKVAAELIDTRAIPPEMELIWNMANNRMMPETTMKTKNTKQGYDEDIPF
jgi:putative ATP-dependent endonuclease of OLD family